MNEDQHLCINEADDIFPEEDESDQTSSTSESSDHDGGNKGERKKVVEKVKQALVKQVLTDENIVLNQTPAKSMVAIS